MEQSQIKRETSSSSFHSAVWFLAVNVANTTGVNPSSIQVSRNNTSKKPYFLKKKAQSYDWALVWAQTSWFKHDVLLEYVLNHFHPSARAAPTAAGTRFFGYLGTG